MGRRNQWKLDVEKLIYKRKSPQITEDINAIQYIACANRNHQLDSNLYIY